MRYLGLDLGSKTLGVAISDPLGIIASSVGIIRHNEEYDRLIEEVRKIVLERGVDKIVLGLPKNMNNTIGPRGKLSQEFKEKLSSTLNIEVFLEDERLSTKEAENILIKNDTSRKKRKKVIDSMAAVIILQSFLDKKGR